MTRWRPCTMSLQSCPTLCNPTDYSPPGSSVHGILQAGILEWAAIFSSRGLNSCLLYLLRWQVSSLPLVLPGKPHTAFHLLGAQFTSYWCEWHYLVLYYLFALGKLGLIQIEKYHVKTAFDLSPSITISSISAGTLSSIVSKSLFLLYIWYLIYIKSFPH